MTGAYPDLSSYKISFRSERLASVAPEADAGKEKAGEIIGIFNVVDSSPVALNFAKYMTKEHTLHADGHAREMDDSKEGSVQLREATAGEYAVVKNLFEGTFAVGHAQRFNAKINGVLFFGEPGSESLESMTVDDWPSLSPEDAFPGDLYIVGWHGTNASRAVEIIGGGFKQIEETKSGPRMYGHGSVYLAENSSKSMGYFHPGYYNDRESYKQGGVMFLVRPKLKDKPVYVASDALWGNQVEEPDGTRLDDWRSKYDAVFAMSRADAGFGYGRPNFREMSIKDPGDAEIVAAVWLELVPPTSLDFDRDNPVKFPESPSSSVVEEEEKAAEFTSLDEALKSLPYEGSPRILRKTNLEATGMCESANHNFPGWGLELRRGDCVTFTLPESQQGQILDTLNVLHRKDRKYNGSVRRNVTIDGVFRKVSDTEGAYTKIFVFDENSKQWVLWPDPYKRTHDKNYGAKYAEPRPPGAPEVECLYDWLRAGKIKPSHVVAMGWGQGHNAVTNFHGLEVGVLPENGLSTANQIIFTPGTRFVEEGMDQPQYGGRNGSYPNSVRLSSHSEVPRSMPENCTLDHYGNLRIRVTEAMDLSRLEVSCGDTHPDGGTLGWAKLSAEVVLNSQGGRKVNLMSRQNVPPNGVLKGSPMEKLNLQPGDEIVLRAEDDSHLYVMGVRFQ